MKETAPVVLPAALETFALAGLKPEISTPTPHLLLNNCTNCWSVCIIPPYESNVDGTTTQFDKDAIICGCPKADITLPCGITYLKSLNKSKISFSVNLLLVLPYSDKFSNEVSFPNFSSILANSRAILWCMSSGVVSSYKPSSFLTAYFFIQVVAAISSPLKYFNAFLST